VCEKCGAFFISEYQPDGRFRVYKITDATRVVLDEFSNELEAAFFANQLHADRLKEFKLFGQFKECSRL
jgi:hypothetical protein